MCAPISDKQYDCFLSTGSGCKHAVVWALNTKPLLLAHSERIFQKWWICSDSSPILMPGSDLWDVLRGYCGFVIEIFFLWEVNGPFHSHYCCLATGNSRAVTGILNFQGMGIVDVCPMDRVPQWAWVEMGECYSRTSAAPGSETPERSRWVPSSFCSKRIHGNF